MIDGLGRMRHESGALELRHVVRASHLFIIVAIVVVGWAELTTPFLAVMLSLLALDTLNFWKRRWIPVALFALVAAAVFYAFVLFVQRALAELPDMIAAIVPAFVSCAERFGIQLQLSDKNSLIELAKNSVIPRFATLADLAGIVTDELVALAIGLVAATAVFCSRQIDLDRGRHPLENNLYTLLTDEIALRFITLYRSFATVMGAQVIISAINTILTAVFLLTVSMPYTPLVVPFTFACGLLPIIGNIISNTLIVGIALTVSPKLTVASLLFLVSLHRLEYFLNGKIVDGRNRNPMWLTLTGLIVGEQLLGIPGMILAPVILHYLKTEAAQIEVNVDGRPLRSPLPTELPPVEIQ